MSHFYRCCAHCSTDRIHDVDPDRHDLPCHHAGMRCSVGDQVVSVEVEPRRHL